MKNTSPIAQYLYLAKNYFTLLILIMLKILSFEGVIGFGGKLKHLAFMKFSPTLKKEKKERGLFWRPFSWVLWTRVRGPAQPCLHARDHCTRICGMTGSTFCYSDLFFYFSNILFCPLRFVKLFPPILGSVKLFPPILIG